MKLIIKFTLILLLSTQAHAQNWDTLPWRSKADFKLQQLDKSQITTGILYDRVFPLSNLQEFDGLSGDTTSPRHFLQAYYEIYHSAYNNNSWVSPERLDSAIKSLNGHPIGVFLYKYETIDTNALEDNLLDTVSNGQFVDVAGRSRSPYVINRSFLAAPLLAEDQVFDSGEHIFYIDPQFFLRNDQFTVTQIRVDFGDGLGEWVIDYPFANTGNGERNVVASITKALTTSRMGRILVIGYDLLGYLIQYGSPFPITVKNEKPTYQLTECKGAFQPWVIEADPIALQQINTQYAQYNVEVLRPKILKRTGPGLTDIELVDVKDTAFFFFADGNCASKTIRRPIVFIDGFDPVNDRSVREIFQNYINTDVQRNINGVDQTVAFGDYMLNNGNGDLNDDLDLIILDFKHGNDLIERNALTLVALLQRLNQTYGANYLQDITLIGPSMGALIAQYALAYMETNNIAHRVKTYVSFDGPHQGANVPIGLQYFVQYFTKRGILKDNKTIRDGLYNGYGARQMLAHHQKANSSFPAHDVLRTVFLQNLAAVGTYPTLSRNVAILNGTNTGALNPNFIQPNQELLTISTQRNGWKSAWGQCTDNICMKLKWSCSTAPRTGNGSKVTEMYTAEPLFNLLFWVPLGKTTFYAQPAWGSSSHDDSPGSFFGVTFGDQPGEIDESKFTFLLKETIFLLTRSKRTDFYQHVNDFTFIPSYNAADLSFPSKNLNLRWDNQYLCGKTPFDYIYAPVNSERHADISQTSSWWFENEIRCTAASLPVFTQVAGPDFFCNNATYVFEYCTPASYNITWSARPSGIVQVTPGPGGQATLTRITDGTITLTASATTLCGSPISISRIISVGDVPSEIQGPYDINSHTVMGVAYTNTTYYFRAIETNMNFPPVSYTWTLFPPFGNPTLYSGDQPYITFSEAGYHQLQLTKTTTCGSISTTATIDVQENMYGFAMTPAPNPVTTDLLTVLIYNETSAVSSLPPSSEMRVELIQVTTGSVARVWHLKNSEKTFTLNVNGLQKGHYILKVTKGVYVRSKQILIQ